MSTSAFNWGDPRRARPLSFERRTVVSSSFRPTTDGSLRTSRYKTRFAVSSNAIRGGVREAVIPAPDTVSFDLTPSVGTASTPEARKPLIPPGRTGSVAAGTGIEQPGIRCRIVHAPVCGKTSDVWYRHLQPPQVSSLHSASTSRSSASRRRRRRVRSDMFKRPATVCRLDQDCTK